MLHEISSCFTEILRCCFLALKALKFPAEGALLLHLVKKKKRKIICNHFCVRPLGFFYGANSWHINRNNLKGAEKANSFLEGIFPYLVLQYFIMVPLKSEFSKCIIVHGIWSVLCFHFPWQCWRISLKEW